MNSGNRNWQVTNFAFGGSIVVTCFSIALGFPEDYFRKAMDTTQPDNLTQMRLLHYPAAHNAEGSWRAGVHTDIGCLTLLFQRDGEDGLEICPGRESHSSFATGSTFFPLRAETGPIVVNIGDMLSMRASRILWKDICWRLKCSSGLVRWSTQSQFSPSSC